MTELNLTFPGDQTGAYDHSTGAGTVGKYVGENGRWHVIVSAVYDAPSGRTRCTLLRVQDPNVVLRQHVTEEWHEHREDPA